MTEDEAKTKACCGSGHRPMENGECIASSCMAWRWDTSRPNMPPAEGKAAYLHGFCGLAGAPQ